MHTWIETEEEGDYVVIQDDEKAIVAIRIDDLPKLIGALETVFDS